MIKKPVKTKEVTAEIESTFKKDWSEAETALVTKAIARAFVSSVEKVDNYFGLPYTSSSDYAMLSGDCNVYHEVIDGWHVDHFALTKNGEIVMVLNNAECKERYFVIA